MIRIYQLGAIARDQMVIQPNLSRNFAWKDSCFQVILYGGLIHPTNGVKDAQKRNPQRPQDAEIPAQDNHQQESMSM